MADRWRGLIFTMSARQSLLAASDLLAKHPRTESSACLQQARRLSLGSTGEAAHVYSMVHNKAATRYPRRALRDLIVWHCCGEVGFRDRHAFIAALHTAFGHCLNKDLLSQLFLSHASIMRCLGRANEFITNDSKRAKRNKKQVRLAIPPRCMVSM